jgi:membrane-associated PAP2 superfamily phosphatase
MKNNADIDKKTREFVKQTSLDNPGEDFTSNVMNRVQAEKAYGLNKRDNNIWQVLMAIFVPLAYFGYLFFTDKEGVIFNSIIQELEKATYFEYIKTFAETIIHDLTVSPIIFMGILAIAALVVFDRVIIKLLHT